MTRLASKSPVNRPECPKFSPTSTTRVPLPAAGSPGWKLKICRKLRNTESLTVASPLPKFVPLPQLSARAISTLLEIACPRADASRSALLDWSNHFNSTTNWQPRTSASLGADPLNDVPLIDDDELMIAMQGGDSRAFETLVVRHQQSLISFFFSNTRDLQFAEDLTQETLLRVYDQSWDYLPTGRFRGWMFRIARNLLIDNIRRRSHDALVKSVRGTGDEHCVLAGLAEELLSPDEQADQRELAGLVEELLQELPEEQRLTFTLHHFADLSLPEVGDILHANTATTKSRLRLAREKLREKLVARGVQG